MARELACLSLGQILLFLAPLQPDVVSAAPKPGVDPGVGRLHLLGRTHVHHERAPIIAAVAGSICWPA